MLHQCLQGAAGKDTGRTRLPLCAAASAFAAGASQCQEAAGSLIKHKGRHFKTVLSNNLTKYIAC